MDGRSVKRQGLRVPTRLEKCHVVIGQLWRLSLHCSVDAAFLTRARMSAFSEGMF